MLTVCCKKEIAKNGMNRALPSVCLWLWLYFDQVSGYQGEGVNGMITIRADAGKLG